MILYSDIDLSFKKNLATSDINRLTNRECIRKSVLRIISLDKLDIPFDMGTYSNIKSILFDTPGHASNASIITNLEWILEVLEPRIKVTNINPNYDEETNTYTINIEYKILRLGIDDKITKTFERVR